MAGEVLRCVLGEKVLYTGLVASNSISFGPLHVHPMGVHRTSTCREPERNQLTIIHARLLSPCSFFRWALGEEAVAPRGVVVPGNLLQVRAARPCPRVVVGAWRVCVEAGRKREAGSERNKETRKREGS